MHFALKSITIYDDWLPVESVDSHALATARICRDYSRLVIVWLGANQPGQERSDITLGSPFVVERTEIQEA
ncbi:MAG: hypothetical protein KDC95_12035 [Planctomycetes bacterium]|nr:hypothetical protein [Planctomycetota bacterium]